ncbi:hypothetical protein [Bacillus pseudomycoides]|uniref:hypothetical protein n=1 Tax=Bacillus pseudomycoides TaxID=64104 RepID=UPI003000839F
MQSQLSFEDILGNIDYAAKSTADRFLRHGPETYEVHFYNTDQKQIIDWFESEDKSGAESAARKKHNVIRIIKTDVSSRSLAEIEELD